MKNTSIALGDHWQRFIAQQVKSGRFGSASEVVREGLRLAEDRQRRIDRLNALIDEGEASGEAVEFDFDAFIAEIGEDDEDEVSDERKAA
jgi:antitoxin ParD1/3/4